jgi:hypothetical protein
MGESHIISALSNKRAELTGIVSQLGQQQAGLAYLDATMRLFDPDIRPNMIRPRRQRARSVWFRPGECFRLIYDDLRDAVRPMTTRGPKPTLRQTSGLYAMFPPRSCLGRDAQRHRLCLNCIAKTSALTMVPPNLNRANCVGRRCGELCNDFKAWSSALGRHGRRRSYQARVRRCSGKHWPPRFFGAKDIAEEGFNFGLPLVMNYGVMYEYIIDRKSPQFKAPFNRIKNDANVFTYKDTAIPTLNSDTPYSLFWMDLRAEPIVISVSAAEPKRYYSVQLCDASTYNYGYIGSRATGSDAGSYMVVAQGWTGDTPRGIKKVFRSGSQPSLAIFRAQLFNSDDINGVKAVQAGYKAQPLSSFLNKPAPPAAPVLDFPKFTPELAKTDFFDFLDLALQLVPAQPNEADVRAKLARIGVGPGKTFNFKDLSLEDKLEVGFGMKEGDRKVTEAVANAGKSINGWRVSSLFGDSAYIDGDWLKRATAARGGIYGNDDIEAMYPLTTKDNGREILDGSQHNYTLTFPAGEQPPVNAFWSLTMYDGKTQLLIENPINRYLINSPMLPTLKTNADGSLTLYIQNKSPGADKEANWLPAPNGPIYLVMRLYWPKMTPPSILPAGEGTWHPPGVTRAE